MIGKTLGHYDIVAELGTGGMGEVYLAVDTKLERKIALKILPESLASDPDRLERFKREARSLAAVNHPNIVGVYSVEEHAGVHFLTMELVEGDTLARIISPGGLPLEQIFEIALPLSEALAEAHEAGIVHRDLKPSNLMLTGSGRLKMLDFGLAKAIEGDVDPGASQLATEALTAEGTVVGTVPYMSPEQIEAKPLDARSDIFSLGTILYEMATGERPFQGDSGPSLMSSILKDNPRDVTQLRTDLPRHLGRIIRQCLEKNPDNRTQTARDVHNQIRSLERETSSEQSEMIPETVVLEPAPRKNRVVPTLTTILVLTLLGYAAWRGFGPQSSEVVETDQNAAALANEKPLIIVMPFENLGEADDQYFADGMTEEVISRLAVLEDLAVISRTTAMQYKGQRPTIAEISAALGVDYVLEGTVRWQRTADGPSRVRVTPQLVRVSDDTPMWAERYDAVLADIFAVQSDVAAQVSEQLGIALEEAQRELFSTQPTANMEAYDAFLRGNEYLNRAFEVHDGDDALIAIQMYDKAISLDPGFTLAHVRAAVAHSWIFDNRFDRTAARQELALQAANAALELEPDSPDAHFALGWAYFVAHGRNDEALEELEVALAGQPGSAEIYEVLSFVQTRVGRWEDALASLLKATELNPSSGRLRCWSGGQCLALRRYGEAELYHELAIERTPDRACPYACRIWIRLNREGGTARARELLEGLPPAIGLNESPPLNHTWVTVDMMDGRYDDALARLESGESPVYDWTNFYVPKDLLAAQIHALKGNAELAREHYQLAADHLEGVVEARPVDSRAHSTLGIAYAALGRKEEAILQGELSLEVVSDDRGEGWGYRLLDLAHIYVLVGEVDAALDQLEIVVSEPTFFSTHYVEADPTFDALHGHPRFQEIMTKHAVKETPRREHA